MRTSRRGVEPFRAQPEYRLSPGVRFDRWFCGAGLCITVRAGPAGDCRGRGDGAALVGSGGGGSAEAGGTILAAAKAIPWVQLIFWSASCRQLRPQRLRETPDGE